MRFVTLFTGLTLALMTFQAMAHHKPGHEGPDNVINLCTGNPDGVYYDAGSIIQKWSGNKVEVNIIETDGARIYEFNPQTDSKMQCVVWVGTNKAAMQCFGKTKKTP